jgi:hypothetical protein
MSADYDLASNIYLLQGTLDDQTEDGTAFSAAIDTNAINGRSVTFAAGIATAIAYSAASFVVQESVDGSTWTAADAGDVVFPKPADLSTTSKWFHVGYMGKKQYVRAAFSSGGPTGQVVAIIGHLISKPALNAWPTSWEG